MRTISLLLLTLAAGCSPLSATPDATLTEEAPCDVRIEEAIATALAAFRDRAADPAGDSAGVPAVRDGGDDLEAVACAPALTNDEIVRLYVENEKQIAAVWLTLDEDATLGDAVRKWVAIRDSGGEMPPIVDPDLPDDSVHPMGFSAKLLEGRAAAAELTQRPPSEPLDLFAQHDDHHAEILRLESRIAELEDGDECNPMEGFSGLLYVGAEWCEFCPEARVKLQSLYRASIGLASHTYEADFDKQKWTHQFVKDGLPCFVVFRDGVEKRRLDAVPESPEAIWKLVYPDTPYPTTTSYGSSSNGEYASTSWVPVVGAPAPGGGVVVSVSGGGCPCGCNGQCGGQCGCPDCPCRTPQVSPQARPQVSNRGAFPDFTIDGHSARSMSYADLAEHATGAHGMSVVGKSWNDIGWDLYTDHSRNGWGKNSGAHRNVRPRSGRSSGGLFSGLFGRRSCPPGMRCP